MQMLGDEPIGSRAIQLDNVQELIIRWCELEVLHTNATIFAVNLGDHGLDQPIQHSMLCVLPSIDTFGVLKIW